MLQNERVVAILCQGLAFMSHANITQMVKSCYKIKICFRDFSCRFSGVLPRCWPYNIQEKPLLRSDSGTIRV